MITLPGTLTVRTINGRHGPFNVGKLITDIGQFVVKSPQLEQFSEGMFNGEFVVTQIKPSSYVSGGRIVFEIRAEISDLLIFDEKVTSKDPELEPDPIDEAVTESPVAGTAAVEQSIVDVSAALVEPESSTQVLSNDVSDFGYTPTIPARSIDPDQGLFGFLYPLAQTVKLDTTIERAKLRRQ